MSMPAVAQRWSVIGGAWLLIGTCSLLQIQVARSAQGQHTPLVTLLWMELPVWLVWALATPLIALASRRFPVDRGRIFPAWGMHFGLAVLAGAAYVGFRMVWYQAFNPYPLLSGTPSTWYWVTFRQVFILGFVIYWAVLGVHHAIVNHQRFRERDRKVGQVSAQLAEAKLHALTTQLQPHFLFNTLNSISALVGEEPREARRVLARLSDLLRATLDAGALQEVPLARDLALLRSYLAIEQVRFGNRLHYEMEIDGETEAAAVPGLLLQPLVENAIRHGFGRREAPGLVRVTAARRNGTLELHVEDDGDGLQGRVREGIGLGNTRRRLAELYGPDQSLRIADRPGGGVDVCVLLPFRIDPTHRRAAG